MAHWYMLAVVGKDRAGIVARLSRALADAGCNLGEASMARLGGNFTIMMMVQGETDEAGLETILGPVVETLDLHLHIDRIESEPHSHPEPNVQVRVYSADRTGIVADVTEELAAAGFHILDLDSDVSGTAAEPVYIMILDGFVEGGTDALEPAVSRLRDRGVTLGVESTATLVG
jgi:glycine cleavage system transcriptional repressor